MTALLVGVFGIAGALLRFAVDGWLAGTRRRGGTGRGLPCWSMSPDRSSSDCPWAPAAAFGPEWHSALATGLAGGLTTFSSWTTATVRLASERRYLAAAGNILANLLLGLAAAAAGLAITGG